MKKVIKVKASSHMWTKDEIRRVVKVWESSTPEDIGKELGVTRLQVNQIAGKLRKAGVNLTKKRQAGYLSKLINEVANEIR